MSDTDFKIYPNNNLLGEYLGKGGEVIIPETVKSIYWQAFYENEKITSVVLPKELWIIEKNSFQGCSALETVTMNYGLGVIDKFAFANCKSLKSVVIPDTVKLVWESAFSGCTSLEEVTLSTGLTELKESVFSGCKSLKSVEVPEGVVSITSSFTDCTSLETVILHEGLKNIYWYSFKGCKKLENINIPTTVAGIGEEAFKNCAFSSITLPENLGYISKGAFNGCRYLKEITLPYKLTVIHEKVFMNCSSLLTVSFTKNITEIEENAFAGCVALKSINYFGTPEDFAKIKIAEGAIPEGVTVNFVKAEEKVENGCVYSDGVLIRYEGEGGVVAIPKEVIKIAENAFRGCKSVKMVNVHSQIDEIETGAFAESGIERFNCRYYVNKVGDYAFKDCKSLTYAEFPAHFTELGKGAFEGCSELSVLKLTGPLWTIGEGAFEGCDKLKCIYYDGSMENWSSHNHKIPEGIKVLPNCKVTNGNGVLVLIGGYELSRALGDMDGYLLKIEGEHTRSYDNSDDERAGSSSSSTPFVSYRELDPYKNSEGLLYIKGKICGVVFRIKSGRDVTLHTFTFSGSTSQTVRLGYSASHSSSYTYIERVSLVKRGEDGAPEEGGSIRFELSEDASFY